MIVFIDAADICILTIALRAPKMNITSAFVNDHQMMVEFIAAVFVYICYCLIAVFNLEIIQLNQLRRCVFSLSCVAAESIKHETQIKT